MNEPTRMTLELPAEVLDAIAEQVEQQVVARLAERERPSEFLTVKEAAELLRARPQRVHDLTSAGVLRRYKDGARTLISRAELLEHLGAERCPSVAHPRGDQCFNGAAG